jgi:hypothetical protein
MLGFTHTECPGTYAYLVLLEGPFEISKKKSNSLIFGADISGIIPIRKVRKLGSNFGFSNEPHFFYIFVFYAQSNNSYTYS